MDEGLSTKVMALAKRRGFLWPAYEIYGGVAGLYDYGPLGASMKRNIEKLWRKYYISQEGFVEIESPLVAPEEVFKASGHLTKFLDTMVECIKCSEYYRTDHLAKFFKDKHSTKKDADHNKLASLDRVINCEATTEDITKIFNECGVKCSTCGAELGTPHPFNLMFKTNIGPGSKRVGYLRPETAQGMFVNFGLLYRFFREKLPFGVVQIGKGFRNEIAPRQGVIRLREFTMAEAEIFVNPKKKNAPNFEKVKHDKITLVPRNGETLKTTIGDAAAKNIIANEMLAYHVAITNRFLTECGVSPEKLRFRQHLATEMAHYAADCWDAEALMGFGWIEIVGIADRTCYDLQSHMDQSKADLRVSDGSTEVERETVVPKAGTIGPRYKRDANFVKGGLEKFGSTEDVVKAAKEKGEITFNILDNDVRLGKHKDGRNIVVNSDCYEVVKKKEQNKIVPHVIEPSYGIDRIFYTILEHSYNEQTKENEKYVTLNLPPHIAPIQVGVFPLVSKDKIDEKAEEINKELREHGLVTYYDDSGSIGRRYARMDEIGTPYCVTIDYETLENESVTIRDRDTTKQERVRIKELKKKLQDSFSKRH
ncbi:MAG: glycine--tRNA ligase [Thermoplasmata archaeon]